MPQKGEIVALDPQTENGVMQATSNTRPSGIVATAPGFIGNGPICKLKDNNCDANYAKDNAIVSLAGQVPLKVNNENGAIRIGDSVTISSEAGVGMKAYFGDIAVGYALEESGAYEDHKTIMVYVANHTAFGMNPNPEDLGGDKALADSLPGAEIFKRMTKLVSGFVDGVLTLTGLKVESVKTEQLCIGTTCINESELIELMQQNTTNPYGGNGGGDGDTPPSAPDPVPVSNPTPIPTSTPDPIPDPVPEPVPALDPTPVI